MPVTIRGKQEQTAGKKDLSSSSSTTAKVDRKTVSSKLSGGAKTPGGVVEAPKSLTDTTSKSTESPKTTSSRQRARDRRRERVEVSPETDSPSPDPGAAGSGRIKDLAGFWSTPKNEVQVVSKKRLEIADRTVKDSEESESDDSDELDGVKRAHEASAADREELVEIEKGRAKSMANMWQNRKEDDTMAKKKPFKLDIKTEEPTVFENEPVVLEGVVRSEDGPTREKIVVRRPGRIKDLAVNFANISSQPRSDDSDEDETTGKNSTTTKEEVIERGKVHNVRERWKKRQQKSRRGGAEDADSDTESSSSSNDEDAVPQRRARTAKGQVVEQAKIRNLRDKWIKRQEGSEDNGEIVQAKPTAPARLKAMDTAKEYGVFENEPIIRDDVVRADDEQPDIISCERTKKLRRMWTMMEKEGRKDKDAKPSDAGIRSEKKEHKQEPEPEASKTPPSKLKKSVSGRHQGQKETSKSKEDGKSREPPDSGKTGAKDQRSEGKGKLQKAYTVAAADEIASKISAPPKSPSLARYTSRKKHT